MKLAQYKLSRRLKFRGLDVSIETDEGEIRHWTDKESGTEGKTKFRVPYGYIRRTEGMDGDHVDVFIGPYENADNVYVIHQRKLPDFKKFDEDKCMLGFGTAEEAKTMYLNHFNDDRFFGSMTTMPFAEFKQKVLATFETPKKLAGALQYRQETPMSLSQALHQFAKTGAPTVQDSAEEATDITRKLRGFARRRPVTLGSESASNLAAKTAGVPKGMLGAMTRSKHPYATVRAMANRLGHLGAELGGESVGTMKTHGKDARNLSKKILEAGKTAEVSASYALGAQQAASHFRPKTAKDWASEVKSNASDAIRRAGKEMAHDATGQVGIESSMAVKKLRDTIREKQAAGELSPEMMGGGSGGPSLGDPNFWGGGSQQAGQSAQPQDAEEAIGLLPGGTFQGANIKIAPDGQKSTSVKVSPDALSDPNSLAQFFQLPEPGTKIEISLPDQVPTVPVQGGGGGGAGAGPVPGGAAPADPGMMG